MKAKELKTLIFLNLLLFVLIGENLFSQTEPEIKRRLMLKHLEKKNWQKLELVHVFPTLQDEEKMVFLSNPTSIDLSDSFIYVVDHMAHKVLKFDKNGRFIETIGRKGEGPGEFVFPLIIRTSEDGRLFLYEGGNLRFQIIDRNGKVIKTFRTFYPMHDFIVVNDLIYANCRYREEGKENPLIVQYDMEGKIIDFFGRRIDRKGHRTLDSDIFLEKFGNKIIAVFRYYPLIRQYTFEGKLLKESRIDLDILNELEKYNFNKEYTSPDPYTIRLMRLVAGIKVVDERVFILLHLPRVEIVEMDMDGNLKNYYYYSESPKNVVNLGGFSVIKRANSLIFYVLQSYNEPKLYIFKTKRR